MRTCACTPHPHASLRFPENSAQKTAQCCNQVPKMALVVPLCSKYYAEEGQLGDTREGGGKDRSTNHALPNVKCKWSHATKASIPVT